MKITYAAAYDSLSHGDGTVFRAYCDQEGIVSQDHAAEFLDEMLDRRREADGADHTDIEEAA